MILDLQSGSKYTLKNTLISQKNYPLFRMISLYPSQNRMILLWSHFKDGKDNSLIEIRSIKENTLISRYEIDERIEWIELHNEKIFYSTLWEVKTLWKTKKKTIFKIQENEMILKVSLIKDKLLIIDYSNTLRCIDLSKNKICFKEQGVFFADKYRSHFYYIKRIEDSLKYDIFKFNIEKLESVKILKSVDLASGHELYIPLSSGADLFSIENRKDSCQKFLNHVVFNNEPQINHLILNKVKKTKYKLGYIKKNGNPMIIQIIPKVEPFKKYLIGY